MIATCLIADMATPLCPGAFRLDPAESIDGLRSRMDDALRAHTSASPLPGARTLEVDRTRSQAVGREDLAVRVPVRGVLARAALPSAHLDRGSPRSSEDG